MANFFHWLNAGFEDGSPKEHVQSVNTEPEPKGVVVAEVIKPKLYTAEDVQRDLVAMVLLFLTDIQQETERKEVPAVIQQDSALLSEFGFFNAKNTQIANSIKKSVAAHNKEYEEKKLALAFMEEVWKKFGKEAMVVRYDHFFKILEKYDMVCGSFERYTGTIPNEALGVLASLKDMWEKGCFSQKFGMAHSYASTFTLENISSDLKRLKNRARMPFRVEDKEVMRVMERLTFTLNLGVDKHLSLGSLSDALFIAAPAADMKPLDINIIFNPPHNLSRSDFDWPHQYEAAVNSYRRKREDEIQAIIEKSSIPRYCKCDFIKTQPLPERKVYDPFICSLTRYGVLIHAKWGAEAEDATIKRYEQLRDAVIGKGIA
ncbi:MAG: hypothetical protein NC418_02465 [Muribaculaceae bacterium]|nr:hypothetical protein [Muribaculaceae bacterium]